MPLIIYRKPSAQFTYIEWKPYQENHEFMRIGNGSTATISIQDDFLAEKMKFWEHLMKDVSYPLEESIVVSNETNNNNNETSGNNEPDGASFSHDNQIILSFLSVLFLLCFIC